MSTNLPLFKKSCPEIVQTRFQKCHKRRIYGQNKKADDGNRTHNQTLEVRKFNGKYANFKGRIKLFVCILLNFSLSKTCPFTNLVQKLSKEKPPVIIRGEWFS